MSKKQEFTYAGISLPINPDKDSGAPSAGNYVKSGVNKKMAKQIMTAIKKNMGLLLEGPTGCGKTATIKWLAAMTNNKYERIQLTGSTDVDSLIGRYVLINGNTVWKDGPLTTAMRNGYWVVLDEINMALPEVLAKLNSVLDDDASITLDDKEMQARTKADGSEVYELEVVKCHENFRLFATQNPWEDYAGTKELNTATLGRFQKLDVTYPEPKNEADIIASHTGIKTTDGEHAPSGLKSVLSRLVEYATVIRAKQEKHEVSTGCSTRQLIAWGNLLDCLTFKEAAEMTILNLAATKTDKENLKVELDKFFKNGETLEKCIAEADKAIARDKKLNAAGNKPVVEEMDSEVEINTIDEEKLNDVWDSLNNPKS